MREEDGEKEKGRDGWERNWWTLRDLYGPESHIMSLLQHSVGQSSYKVHLVLVGRNTDCTTQWWSITLLEGISNGMYIGTAICGQYTLCKKVGAQFSCSVVSDSLRPQALQHTRLHSQSVPKLVSIKSVMTSHHLLLCHSLLLPPSIFPSIRVFSNESVLRIR